MTAIHRPSLAVLAAGLFATLLFSAMPASGTQVRRHESVLQSWDTDHDGTLDLNEVRQAAAARFDHMDTNHDGILDQKDRGPRLVTADIRAADTDHDGSVSRDEYLVLVQSRFKAADTDRDGTLDARELDSSEGRALMRLLK